MRCLLSLAPILCLTASQGLVPGLDPIDPHARAAYFTFLDPTTHNDYVFALNAVDNGDIYFHMSTRQRYQWIGVGIGDQMAGAFMLIAYAASNGTGLVTSPRIAIGHSEPTHTHKIEVIGVYSDAYAPNADTITKTGAMVSHAMCRNCTRWMSDYLDTRSTQQPFIFALGPKLKLDSDALDAGLSRHQFYGHFNMDMTAAFSSNGYGRVPAPNVEGQLFNISDSSFATFASTQAYGTSRDIDRAPFVHGVLMCIAFFGVFPLGALLLRSMKSVLYHAVAQGLGLVMVIVGFSIAVSISSQYNRAKHFNSAHQSIGLLVSVALLIQLGLGLGHHMKCKRTTQPTVMGKVHLFLGPTILVLGIINGGLGLQLAGNSKTPYIVVIVVFAIIFGLIRFWLCRAKGIRQYKPERFWADSASGVEGDQDDAGSPSSFQMYARSQTPMDAAHCKKSDFASGPESPHFEMPVNIMRPDTSRSPGRASILENLSTHRGLKEDWSLYRQGKL